MSGNSESQQALIMTLFHLGSPTYVIQSLIWATLAAIGGSVWAPCMLLGAGVLNIVISKRNLKPELLTDRSSRGLSSLLGLSMLALYLLGLAIGLAG